MHHKSKLNIMSPTYNDVKKQPKLFRNLFNLTAHDEKIPTDTDLDNKIEELGYCMHYIWPLLGYIIKKKLWFFFRYKWRIWLKKIGYTAILGVAIYFAWVKVAEPIFIIKQKTELITNIHEEYKNIQIPKGNLEFMTTISKLESRHTFDISNGQYWGAFQLGEAARKEIGLASIDKETFLHDSIIQIWAMNKYMEKNFEYIKNTIIKYKIPTRGGVLVGNHLVTQSGFLGASHLVGAFAAIDFIKSNGVQVAIDGNGVALTKYLELNNIELELDK